MTGLAGVRAAVVADCADELSRDKQVAKVCQVSSHQGGRQVSQQPF